MKEILIIISNSILTLSMLRFISVFDQESKKQRIIIVCVILFLLIYYPSYQRVFSQLIFMIVSFLFFIIFYKQIALLSIKTVLPDIIIGVWIMISVQILSILLCMIVLHIPYNNVLNDASFSLLRHFVSSVLSPFLCVSLADYRKSNYGKWEILPVNILAVESALIVLYFILSVVAFNFVIKEQSYYICMLLLVLSAFFPQSCLYFLYKEQQKLVKQQVHDFKKNITMLQTQTEVIQIMKHDLRHDYLILNELLHRNQVEEAMNYLNKKQNVIEQNSSYLSTGFLLIDAILNNHYLTMQKKKIPFRYFFDLKQLYGYKENELAILLSNALDNAIQNIDMKSPYILLRIIELKEQLSITVTNSTEATSMQISQHVNTSSLHGIGTLSMKMTAKQYRGSIDWSIIEGKCVCNIQLYPLSL